MSLRLGVKGNPPFRLSPFPKPITHSTRATLSLRRSTTNFSPIFSFRSCYRGQFHRIDFGDFFKGPLPGKFVKLLGYLALSRIVIYIPLGGVIGDAFLGNMDQNSLLSTLDSFSGGGIGRLGVCSLGIVPVINAQIVFQLLAQFFRKLQELQKREGDTDRKKIYTL